MRDAPDLRASDDDRERVATELREHYAQGRLGQDELSERLEAVYAARTAGELESLRADLPALRPGSRPRRADLTRELLQQTGGALVPFLVCTVIWLFSGASGSFWPAWTLLIAFVPLLRNGWHLYGPSPDLDRVESNLRREGHRRRHGPRRYVTPPALPRLPADDDDSA
jgi:hypothetical protein